MFKAVSDTALTAALQFRRQRGNDHHTIAFFNSDRGLIPRGIPDTDSLAVGSQNPGAPRGYQMDVCHSGDPLFKQQGA